VPDSRICAPYPQTPRKNIRNVMMERISLYADKKATAA